MESALASCGGITNSRCEIKLWDATTGQECFHSLGTPMLFNSVAFSPDGSQLVSGSHDNFGPGVDVDTGKSTLTLVGHTAPVSSVAFGAFSETDCHRELGRRVKLGFKNGSAASAGLQGHGGEVKGVTFSPDSDQVAIVSGGNETVPDLASPGVVRASVA